MDVIQAIEEAKEAAAFAARTGDWNKDFIAELRERGFIIKFVRNEDRFSAAILEILTKDERTFLAQRIANFIADIKAAGYVIVPIFEVAQLQPDVDSPGLWIGFKTAEQRNQATKLFRVVE